MNTEEKYPWGIYIGVTFSPIFQELLSKAITELVCEKMNEPMLFRKKGFQFMIGNLDKQYRRDDYMYQEFYITDYEAFGYDATICWTCDDLSKLEILHLNDDYASEAKFYLTTHFPEEELIKAIKIAKPDRPWFMDDIIGNIPSYRTK